MKIHLLAAIFFLVLIMGCDAPTDDLTEKAVSEAELKRDTFFSEAANSQREYFVYLPKGYNSNLDKKWPLLMFLHGNGERGNGQEVSRDGKGGQAGRARGGGTARGLRREGGDDVGQPIDC